MIRWLLAFVLLILGGLDELQACFPSESLEVRNTDVNMSTLFYVTSRKKSVRMGLAAFNGQSYYNLYVCDEYKEFNIEDANEWDPNLCKALSPAWIPFVTPWDEDIELLTLFTDLVRTDLMEKLDSLETKEQLDPLVVTLIEGFDTGLNVAIGFGLQYYATRFVPASRFQRLGRSAARGAGWFVIFTAIFGGGLDIARQIEEENIYHQKIKALSQIINDIDEGVYFNEDSPSSQVLNILELIENAIQRSAGAIYNKYCIGA